MIRLRLADGAVYEFQDGSHSNNGEDNRMTKSRTETRQVGSTTTWGQLAKERVAAIERLEKAAGEWEAKVNGTHLGNMDPNVREYLTEKAAEARREAARLKGEDVPEPQPVAKSGPVTVVLPR
jgi:hypothetical protein